MLLTGMILVSAILFLYPLTVTGWQLFIARFFHGLAGGLLIPAAFAYVGDNSKPETRGKTMAFTGAGIGIAARSEEHTSELQSRGHLVCRLLLEKKKYR